MPPPKVDFDIELSAELDLPASSLRPGQELGVALDAESGELRVTTADGAALGRVPPAAARQLSSALRVTVRSVKKRADDPSKLAGVQARAVPAEAEAGARACGGTTLRTTAAEARGTRRRCSLVRQLPLP
jgi:hypothetical protein